MIALGLARRHTHAQRQNIGPKGVTGKILRNKELARAISRSEAAGWFRILREVGARFDCPLSVFTVKVVRHIVCLWTAVEKVRLNPGRGRPGLPC